MRFLLPWLIGLLLSVSRLRWEPFPAAGVNPFLDLVAFHDPVLYYAIAGWYYLAPWAAAGIGGAVLLSVWQVWFSRGGSAAGGRGSLPRWPVSDRQQSLSLVVGETHHPTEAVESPDPGWLVLGEKGLFTGAFVCGAVGTGKTSACMHPFAEQLFSFQAQTATARRRASFSKSRATSAMPSATSSNAPAASRTTSKSGSAAAGSGTPWTPTGWTPTRSPTPSPGS